MTKQGFTADDPILLWDRMDIIKFMEINFGEDFFLNGEQVVKRNDGELVKLIQIKMDSTGEYKNLYFAKG